MEKKEKLKLIASEDKKDVEKRDFLVNKRRVTAIKNTVFSVGCAAVTGYAGEIAYNFSASAHPMRAMACAIGTGVALTVFTYVSVKGIRKHRKFSKTIRTLNNSFIQRIEQRYDSKALEEANSTVGTLKVRSNQPNMTSYKPYLEATSLLSTQKEVLKEKRAALEAYGVLTKSEERKLDQEDAEATRTLDRYYKYKAKFHA